MIFANAAASDHLGVPMEISFFLTASRTRGFLRRVGWI
jgi:hypothetical protein